MHELGIVHRDLKPDNIMLLSKPEPDTVKIIDFGLVKIEPNSNQKLTATGLLIGSVNYMSPEQCLGKKADARSDIYSLAVCMYEMLAGKPPFTADNPVGVMYKQVNLQAPELRLADGRAIDRNISQFINKGLEKDPALRFQTAAEMNQVISNLSEYMQSELPASAKSTGGKIQKTLINALFVLSLVALMVSAFISLSKQFRQYNANNATKSVKKSVIKESSTANKESDLKGSLTRAEKRFGPHAPSIIRNLDDLASLYGQQGRDKANTRKPRPSTSGL
jgi:serine/threonine protein kinase